MVEIRRLSEAELDDFLAFMDGPAFETNPSWNGCYCQFYLNTAEENESRASLPPAEASAENRSRACDKVKSGQLRGYLAFEGETVVGWVAANAANNFALLPRTGAEVARVLCFVIDAKHQRQGISAQLLDFALNDLAAQGFSIVEAAPLANDEFAEWAYRGKRSTFEKAGFETAGMIDEKHILVRRKLTT